MKTTTEASSASGLHSAAEKRLLAFIERIEMLREEKASLAQDEREVFGEAKAAGYDTKAMRKCLKLRATDDHQRMEEDALEATYRKALGITSNQFEFFDDCPTDEPSPIAVLGRTFDNLVNLAGQDGKANAIEFNGKGFELERASDGALIIREVVKPQPKKKAA